MKPRGFALAWAVGLVMFVGAAPAAQETATDARVTHLADMTGFAV